MRIEEKAGFPRPDFVRSNFQLLDGDWEFEFSHSHEFENALNIKVPFVYQSRESGIESREKHEKVAYRKVFSAQEHTGTVLLHFGAVDRECSVYLNNIYIGSHTGGYTPFSFDVTGKVLCGRENTLTVFVTDENRPDSVRGKQIWEGEPSGCHYTEITGIWQSVWLEYTGGVYVVSARHFVNFDELRVTTELVFSGKLNGEVRLELSSEGEDICTVSRTVCSDRVRVSTDFADYGLHDSQKLNWTLSHPRLIDCDITLYAENCVCDTVSTYFGFRKVSVEGGRVYFNNSILYLRGVLDQGYWSEGIYRPADEDGYRKDVELILSLGFNLARKHQKIEDPKFYYWADRLGLLVWGELPSFYSFNEKVCEEARTEMRSFIMRDFNHPCIIAWVPFNETWGLRKFTASSEQQNFAASVYFMCKSLDPTRFVSTNDGWENPEYTDINSVHDYRRLDKALAESYGDTSFFKDGCARTGHPFLLPGTQYEGKPVLFTEYGGIPFCADSEGAEEKFVEELKCTQENLLGISAFCGYCYTQLTDVYQEQNGLCYMNREPKAGVEELRKIFVRDPVKRN